MYIRSLLICMSLMLSNPIQSNPLNRLQRFMIDPLNRSIFKMGVTYVAGYAFWYTALYRYNVQKNPLSHQLNNDKSRQGFTQATKTPYVFKYGS